MNYTEIRISKYFKTAAYLSGFLAFVLFVYVLVLLKPILIPLTIAVFLTFLFHPLLKLLLKLRLPAWFGSILIIAVICFAGYILAGFLLSSFEGTGERIEYYTTNIDTALRQILKPFNISVNEFYAMIGLRTGKDNSGDFLHSLIESGTVQTILNFITSFTVDVAVTVIFWIFMISGKDRFEKKLSLAFEDNRDKISKGILPIDSQLQSYLVLKTLISLCVAVTTTILLFIFGVDFALLWGLLTFLFNFIPHIGPFTVTIAPIITAILQFGFNFKSISFSILLTILHNVFGNFLEPHYLGKQLDLSPVFVLFSLFFWGLVWGIPGMFLAVPIAASMKIIFSNIEPLKPIAFIMESKSEV